MYDDPVFSDAICRIIFDPPPLSADKDAVAAERKVLKDVHVSSGVLALSSEKFKAQIQRWAAKDGQEERDTKRVKLNANTDCGRILEVVVDREELVEAVETCLKFAYSIKFRIDDVLLSLKMAKCEAKSVATVIDVYQMACYLAQDACRAEALSALSDHAAKLTVDQAIMLIAHTPDIKDDESVKRIASVPLLATFGDVLKVMNSDELKEQFVELPVEAVVILLSHKDLKTDNEDSVLGMAFAWIDNEPRIKTDVRRVLECVRMLQLTDVYFFHMLPSHYCLRDTTLSIAEYGMLSNMRVSTHMQLHRESIEKLLDVKFPLAWRSAAIDKREKTGVEARTRCFSLSKDVVEREIIPQLAKHGLIGRKLDMTWYARGYEWYVHINVNANTQSIGVYTGPMLDPIFNTRSRHYSAWKSTGVSWTLHGGETLSLSNSYQKLGGRGGNAFKFPADKCIKRIEDWDALGLFKDGCLQVTVTLPM